jgi:hypothetical protein
MYCNPGPLALLLPQYKHRSSRVKFGGRSVNQGANLSHPGLTLRPLSRPLSSHAHLSV